MSEMAVLGQRGDTKVIWSKDNADDVAAARAMFDTLVTEKGYVAYSVRGQNGKRDQRIREFDPDAERIIIIPAMQGGA